MTPDRSQPAIRRRVRILLAVFIIGLLLSGATAIPLEAELRWVVQISGAEREADSSDIAEWLVKVRDALTVTQAEYPFIAYGTDWLAFAHFIIAIAFIGPWRAPVRNVWIVEFGMIACVLVVPFAVVMGSLRGIPLGWQLADCSFGVGGFILLWCCRRLIKQLAKAEQQAILYKPSGESSEHGI